MLAGIITTIIMALGIATGNISSNAYKGGNVFNDESQLKPKKAEEQSYTYNYQYEIIDTYEDNPNRKAISKMYLKEQDQTIVTSTVSNLYYTNYNTTYLLKLPDTNITTREYTALISVYKITTFYNTEDMNLLLKQNVYFSNTNGVNTYLYRNAECYIANIDLDEYINITLTSNAVSKIWELYTRSEIKTDRQQTWNQLAHSTSYTETYDNEYEIQSIQASTTTNVVQIYALVAQNSNHTADNALIVPNSLKVTANAILPTVNYEVVDIPGLMYTILTMPFSFISTAFNLTVFPGTPYALNFGNLFLTIIVAFILLWIIRKVFK